MKGGIPVVEDLRVLPFSVRWVLFGSPNWQALVVLRESELRRPLGLTFSPDELAAEHDSWHLAGLLGERMVGGLILKPLDHKTVRLRQMCVAPEYRGRGYGRQLVHAAETHAASQGIEQIQLHAREIAVPFYQRLGYEITGPAFIEVTLRHLPMRRWIPRNA